MLRRKLARRILLGGATLAVCLLALQRIASDWPDPIDVCKWSLALLAALAGIALAGLLMKSGVAGIASWASELPSRAPRLARLCLVALSLGIGWLLVEGAALVVAATAEDASPYEIRFSARHHAPHPALGHALQPDTRFEISITEKDSGRTTQV